MAFEENGLFAELLREAIKGYLARGEEGWRGLQSVLYLSFE